LIRNLGISEELLLHELNIRSPNACKLTSMLTILPANFEEPPVAPSGQHPTLSIELHQRFRSSTYKGEMMCQASIIQDPLLIEWNGIDSTSLNCSGQTIGFVQDIG
jgi:hypothetical protein